MNLAISLHATSNEIRDRIMPVNKGFAIEELLAACKRFPLPFRQRMTFEYVLLEDINDSPEDARRLVRLLKGFPGQGEPHPVQRLGGFEVLPATVAPHHRVPGLSPRTGHHRHGPVEQGRGHRRGLRPAPGGRVRVTAPGTIAVSTLGCRLNQVESQEILALFEGRGFRPASANERPQVHVVNTCTVTGRADFSDRQAIRRIARDNPGALLVVTGCLCADRRGGRGADSGRGPGRGQPGEVSDGRSPRRSRQAPTPEIRVGDVRTSRGVPIPIAPLARRSGRSRAFVKIQDGCQHRCAFCIVPAARGGSRSQEPDVVREQVEALVDAGYREITLTGVDIGHYGRDLTPRTSLAALIARLADVPDLRWLRLSSVLPAYWSDELIEAVTGTPAVVPHLHLPLQSGSDRVLQLMRRPYNLRMFRALVERLAGAIPDLGLGTDLIVGHPGEDDDDFEATLRVVEELPLSYLTCSHTPTGRGPRRPGRARVDAAVAKARSATLRRLAADKGLDFAACSAGRATCWCSRPRIALRGSAPALPPTMSRCSSRGRPGSAAASCPSASRGATASGPLAASKRCRHERRG